MSAGIAAPLDEQTIAAFLTAAAERPSALVIEGEAGIGKTTLLLNVAEQARLRGFRVLMARAAQPESVLAYTAVADLFAGVDDALVDELPDLQRLAVDRVLLRVGADGPGTDHRVVAAALVSVLQSLTEQAPVLLAVDDAQWLDPSSQWVLSFVARRLTGRSGMVLTERCDATGGRVASWVQLSRPDGLTRLRVRPLSPDRLHTVISDRLGRFFPRPTMKRLAEMSAGNPFYALEIARALDTEPTAQFELPATLAELVRMRIERFPTPVREALLAAASVAAPTVDLLAQVLRTTPEDVAELLDDFQADDVVTLDGNRVQFTHPLLAHGVYSQAEPARRRAMHRALAAIETNPELKARHLALASTSAEQDTLTALDAAADAARVRGAPAAAAELMELAMRLGGDNRYRRIRAAGDHFTAGDPGQAAKILEPVLAETKPGPLQAMALNLLAAIRIYHNRTVEAAELLRNALPHAETNPPLLVHTLMTLSWSLSNIGEFDESLRHIDRAASLAEELGIGVLTSQALAWRVMSTHLHGPGHSEADLRRALDLEDHTVDIPISFRASTTDALIKASTGRLEEAHEGMLAVRQRCVERGAEADMMAVAAFLALIELWRGRYAAAADTAAEAVRRAEQLGGDHILIIPLTVRAMVAAYTGDEARARADAAEAIERAEACRSPRMGEWPRAILASLEVSLGNHGAALAALQPVLAGHHRVPNTEMWEGWYLPDAIEAMVATGRTADAVALIEAFETNGARADRPWIMAVGARCRALLLAADGDLTAAEHAAVLAMAHHDRLPMPFERARTQLLLGQLQRRRRQKEAAAANIGAALQSFEQIGAQVWARRARAELARTNVAPGRDISLTPSERQVAEFTASGMTNREVAAALFISPKTVESNLSRVYRKLGIRSRAELGRWLDDH